MADDVVRVDAGRRVRDRVQGPVVHDGARVRAYGADRPAGPHALHHQVLPRGEGAPQGRARARLSGGNRHASEPHRRPPAGLLRSGSHSGGGRVGQDEVPSGVAPACPSVLVNYY